MKPICECQPSLMKQLAQLTLLATSRASWSAVRRTYAFFFPSGLAESVNAPVVVLPSTHLIKVLILAASTSYIFLTASLMCLLLAFKSTINTKVLLSSIFFMADSVFKGCWIVLNWSIRGRWGTLFRGYLGSRASRRVFGRWKETEVRTLRMVWDWVPFRAAFLADLALASWGLAAAKREDG